MSRYKVIVIEHRPNSNYKAPTSFARPASSTLAYIVTEQVEWCDTQEEARKLIRRHFNKHHPHTFAATMELVQDNMAASTDLNQYMEKDLL